MKEQIISFTYGELIEAFNTWNTTLEEGKVPPRPLGVDVGQMYCNYLIATVNKARQDKLAGYNA